MFDIFEIKVGDNDVCDKICTQCYVTVKHKAKSPNSQQYITIREKYMCSENITETKFKREYSADDCKLRSHFLRQKKSGHEIKGYEDVRRLVLLKMCIS